MSNQSDGFIFKLWERVFYYLRYVSLYSVVVIIIKKLKVSHRFVECWVVTHTVMSVGLLILFVNVNVHPVLLWIVVGYGFLRVFEIVVTQINILLFDQYRNKEKGQSYALRSYGRSIILLIHNYIEIIGWYALTYYVFISDFISGQIGVFQIIYSSFITMASFSSELSPATNVGIFIVTSQAFIGLFMTLVSLARFISILPKPDTKDEWEK